MTITHYTGRYLQLQEIDTWEFVSRRHRADVVIIVAVTDEQELLLVEQFRKPVGKFTIELPAGLVGDDPIARDERLEVAARRELEEETGYRASGLTKLMQGPTSAGLTNEMVHIYLANGLQQTGAGGGVDDEQITVHKIHLNRIAKWLQFQTTKDHLLDPKIYAALYWLSKYKTN